MSTEQFHIDIQHLKGAIVDRIVVMKLANAGLVIIRERTLSGKFLPGSSPGAEEYSTKTFARPLGGITKQLQKALLGSSDVHVFENEEDQIWISVTGGYKRYRELAGKDSSRVSMVWSGRMMRNLGVLNASDDSAILGMKDDDTKLLAMYHNVLGAGKSKRKHVFMGFTAAEKERLAKIVGDEAMRRMRLNV